MDNREWIAMYSLGFGLGLIGMDMARNRTPHVTRKKPVPTALEIAEKKKKREKNKAAKAARKKNRR